MNKVAQVLATREGGNVRRCHVLPHAIPYTVGHHSYGAVSLLLLLHPNPSLALIKAVQWHDVAERWCGDMPSTIKGNNPDLKEVYERIEAGVLSNLGLAQTLTGDEQNWLKAVDLLDLFLWVLEERRAGNRCVSEWAEGCGKALKDLNLEDRLPEPVQGFLMGIRGFMPNGYLKRLSDNFHKVTEDLHGPGAA